jgi:uncharacterized protein (DUF4213/DUF364 family)
VKIFDDLLATLDTGAEVRDIRQGLFHTAVLTCHCGLASTLPRDSLKQKPPHTPLVVESGFLMEKSAGELAAMARSESLAEAAIGMATINSLLEIDEEKCLELNAGDLIAEKGAGKRIAIVGHFPFTTGLREIAGELWVVEKNPQEGDYSEEEARRLIPQADVVGVTGTSLTNHTFESIMGFCRPEAYVVILGDSAPLSPVFFDHGVNAVSGTRVVDSELALRCVSQGATFRQIKGKRLLTVLR